MVPKSVTVAPDVDDFAVVEQSVEDSGGDHGIPKELLPSILRALQEMPWVLPAYKADGNDFVKRLLMDLGMIPPSGSLHNRSAADDSGEKP